MTWGEWDKVGLDDITFSNSWFFVRWYERFCVRHFGRPITFILKDLYHENPKIYHALLFLSMAIAGIGGFIVKYFLGALLGHLFW